MQFKFIALIYADGTVGRMQFLTRCSLGQIPLDAVLPGEFALDPNTREWVREPTPSNMAYELRDQPNVASWRLVPDGDPFTSLDHRWGKAWRLKGEAVVADLAEARKVRRAELLARRDVLLDRVRRKVQELQEDGETSAKILLARNKAKALRSLESNLDTQLAAVSDLDALHSFEPTEFQGTN